MNDEQTPEEYLDDMVFVLEMENREINYKNVSARLEEYRSLNPQKVGNQLFFNQVEKLINKKLKE